MAHSRIDRLLAGLAPRVANIQRVSRGEDEGSWEMLFGDDAGEDLLHLAFFSEDDGARLVVGAMLGPALPANRLATYEMVLKFNGLWEETGGQRVALDDDDNLILLADLAVDQLDAPFLSTFLDDFAVRALTWQGLMARGGVAPKPDETGGIPPCAFADRA